MFVSRILVVFFPLLFPFILSAFLLLLLLLFSVLLGLELLLPGLIQEHQSLIVEDEQNEVQCICGDADDAEVFQDEVEDVGQVERAHHRHDGRGHEDQGGHGAHRHTCCHTHTYTKLLDQKDKDAPSNCSNGEDL